MTIIGIDPGKQGAIATIYPDQIIACPMPKTRDDDVDGKGISDVLNDHQPDVVFVEKVHSMPQQGVASTFTFGVGYGKIIGICEAMRIPFVLVTPQQWKKVVLVGLDWKGDKGMSETYIRRKYPNLQLPRNAALRSGYCDAICIAEYGLYLHGRGSNDYMRDGGVSERNDDRQEMSQVSEGTPTRPTTPMAKA